MNLLALPVFALMGIVFHELFVRMHVMTDIRRVLHVAPAATRVIRSDTLSDLEKERTVRRMSVDVLRDTSRFTAKLALVLGACLAVAALAQALFDVSPDGLEGLLTSWWALAALLVVMPFYARLRARGRPDAPIADAVVERSDDTLSNGHAVPAARRSGDRRSEGSTDPVAERFGDYRPEGRTGPVAERSGVHRPDESAAPDLHLRPGSDDRLDPLASAAERTERTHPAPERG